MSFFGSLQAHVYVLPVIEPEVRDSPELGHVLRGVIPRGVVSTTSSRARLVSLLVMTLARDDEQRAILNFVHEPIDGVDAYAGKAETTVP